MAGKLSRRGILLNDESVLSAMESELAGKYLPVRRKRDGTLTGADSLCTLADFGKLLQNMESTIREIGREIKSGNASAHPIRTKKHDACAFCPLKPMCRKVDYHG
ncbi:MAG: hypothetical protein E7632_08915 [Ruminococcaceae bacterium]|nr:hypothetical protein [Oscillospiraceae bacterium]